ncbi:dihydrofolate reductase [Coprobacillus sp. CAG:698]|nr:dihydrofolate reductase [Coprobacillus sp. CAG:698]
MISLIFAMDINNLIGKDNDLPWHYSEDLKYFKAVTSGKKVVMGENTFFSIVNRIGKPLTNRENYVATLANDFNYPNVNVINDLISFLKTIKDVSEEYFIIGGKRIYELSLPYADRLYITHINREYEGNVYFPKINYSEYKKIKSNKIDELDFCVYERIKKEG